MRKRVKHNLNHMKPHIRVRGVLLLTRYRIQQVLLLLFIMVLMLVAFYVFGSNQGFLDATLILIMQLIVYTSLGYMVLAVLQLVLLIIEGIYHKQFQAFLFATVIIGAIVVGALYMGMNFILVWV